MTVLHKGRLLLFDPQGPLGTFFGTISHTNAYSIILCRLVPSCVLEKRSSFYQMRLTLLIVAFALIVRGMSQAPATYFLNPPASGDNVVWTIGTQTDLQWVTNLTAYNIFLWQQSLNVQSAAEGSEPLYSMSRIYAVYSKDI